MTFQLICIAILALVIGVLALVAGYRLFLLLLPIWGFFAGFAMGAHATTLIFGTGFLSTLTSWVVGFLSGLLFAVLSYLIYIIGVALISAAFGYFLGAGLALLFLEPGLIVTIIGLAGAVLVAYVVLAFNIQKPAPGVNYLLRRGNCGLYRSAALAWTHSPGSAGCKPGASSSRRFNLLVDCLVGLGLCGFWAPDLVKPHLCNRSPRKQGLICLTPKNLGPALWNTHRAGLLN